MKMELIEGSETSAIRTQTPVNYTPPPPKKKKKKKNFFFLFNI